MNQTNMNRMFLEKQRVWKWICKVLAAENFGILLVPSHPRHHQTIDCLHLAGICLPRKQVIWKPIMRPPFFFFCLKCFLSLLLLFWCFMCVKYKSDRVQCIWRVILDLNLSRHPHPDQHSQERGQHCNRQASFSGFSTRTRAAGVRRFKRLPS